MTFGGLVRIVLRTSKLPIMLVRIVFFGREGLGGGGGPLKMIFGIAHCCYTCLKIYLSLHPGVRHFSL